MVAESAAQLADVSAAGRAVTAAEERWAVPGADNEAVHLAVGPLEAG